MNPFLEIFLRALGAFVGVIVIARFIGKSQVGQLTISDWVNGIVIGSIAAGLAADIRTSPWYYVLGLVVFTGMTALVQYVGLKYRPARKLFEDEPTVIIHNGKILENNMARMRYNMDNLMMQLREKGYFNIGDVEFAVLEPNGELSVLPKSQKRPVTPADLNLPTQYEGMVTELVVDGVIIEQNLRQNNLNEEWLLGELQKQGVHSLNEVAYAGLDANGNLYVDRKQDTLEYVQDITDKIPGKMPQ
ncbi:MAG: DUF421 domain-containing protein [Bacillota bacterium]